MFKSSFYFYSEKFKFLSQTFVAWFFIVNDEDHQSAKIKNINALLLFKKKRMFVEVAIGG